jgi:UDP-2,3-diacylglucosamine pyrophosphatase LpxH
MDTENVAEVFARRKREEAGPCPWEYKVDDKTYQEAKSGLWGPNEPLVSAPLPYHGQGKEIVVVSDLHIASGRTAVGVFRGSENFFSDDGFARFLDHVESIKATSSVLLVFNGDLFDFLRVSEYPGWVKKITLTRRIRLWSKGDKPVAPARPAPAAIGQEFADWSAELSKVGIDRSPAALQASISKQEKTYGLKTDDYKTIYKLIRIKRGHPVFFNRLGRWLLSGNSILILKGNHDLEICQPKVRQYIELQLAESLAEIAPGTGIGPLLESMVFPTIRFADDSVLIDGDFYLEHGHRYDKFTMVTGSPFLQKTPGEVNIPFGSFFNRYLINRVELYYPYFDKIRPTGNIIPMLIRDNFPLALKVIFQQIPFLLRILSTNGKYVWFMLYRVVWLALIIAVPLALLIWLDWHQLVQYLTGPATTSDKRFDIGQLLSKAAKNVGGLLVPYFLARLVSWFQLSEPDSLFQFARRRDRSPGGPFRIMTMGHTHNPGEYFLDGPNKRFYNTGTWIPVIETSSADVREDRMYTFLHLRRDAYDQLQVANGGLLQRWNDDAGRAEPQQLIERK